MLPNVILGLNASYVVLNKSFNLIYKMGIIISPHRPVMMIKQDSLHKVLSTVPVCRSIVVVIVELPKITQAIRS